MLRAIRASCWAMAALLLWSSTAWGQAGPYERQRPDERRVAAGRSLYAERCINCHGLDVKGTEQGPDLIRSVAVLRDFEGSAIGPAMAEIPGHPANLPGSGIGDISHFLKQQVELTARNRNATEPPDVLSGDVVRGRVFFEGAGGCTACHSVSGDLSDVGSRFSPVNLQQRFLFPRGGFGETPSAVTVRTPEEEVSGTLEFINDFFVSLTDESGTYRSFRRGRGVAVTTVDPYDAHWELLETITDDEIHDVVTYLETLK